MVTNKAGSDNLFQYDYSNKYGNIFTLYKKTNVMVNGKNQYISDDGKKSISYGRCVALGNYWAVYDFVAER